MRTRFLTTDYFNINQTLAFLRLPLPPIQPLPDDLSFISSDFQDELLRCINSSSTDFSLQLGSFPVGHALSKFFSDVLPDTIEAGGCVSPTSRRRHSSDEFRVLEDKSELVYEECAAETCETANSETSVSTLGEEEKTEDSISGKNERRAVLIQLEVPELSQDLENACMSEGEKIQLLSEVQEFDHNLETLNIGLADTFHCHIYDSLDMVKSMPESNMDQKPQIPEEGFPLWNNVRPCDCIFPVFEVDEMGMEDSKWACIDDEIHFFIENIEVQHCGNGVEPELNCQSLLGSSQIGILELINDHHTSKLPLDLESLNSALDFDIFLILGAPYAQQNVAMMDAYLFEEFEMLDSDMFEIFEAHFICQTTREPEVFNQPFPKDMNFKSFDDLIVSCELAVIDDSFISLPVPAVKDDEKTLSLNFIVSDIFSKLEPVPLSTSDEIYLDWHLLQKDRCTNETLTAIEKVFNDVHNSMIEISQNPNDGGMLMHDLLVLDDPLDCLSTTENKIDMPYDRSCSAKQEIKNTVASSSFSDDDCQIIEDIEKTGNAESENFVSGNFSDEDCQIIEGTMTKDGDFGASAPSLGSMSHFSDLDFFLNPRKATASVKVDHKLKVSDNNSVLPNGLQERKAASPIPMQRLDVQTHTICLPANFITVIDNLRDSYLEVLGAKGKGNKTRLYVNNSNDINLLGLPEDSLLEHMKSFKNPGEDTTTNFVTLCAVKRMAWCLCFWGIHTLHLYVGRFFERFGCLRSRLSWLHSLIKDAYVEVEKEITKSHPSLAIIKEILQLNSSRKLKVMILAQRFLWGPLRMILNSMDIALAEVEDVSMLLKQQGAFYNSFNAGPNDQLKTSCLLLSHEDFKPSVLMQNFDIMVEYGGPNGISKASTLCSEYIGARNLHFLKVRLDDVAKALCEGVFATSVDGSTIKLEDMLDFGPIMENSILASSEAAGRTSPSSLHMDACYMLQESKPTQHRDSTSPNVIIVINTLTSCKDMIIARRSTYQKILALEKGGGQVVERDIILPVDIIVDAKRCIVWYDNKCIAGNTTAQGKGSSNMPICIDDIAANVLTSLSFAFTTCILIFEGESNFFGPIMESADELYVAAASLGIYLQIFCSHSPELTDEIILGSIAHSMKFSKGLLPRLPESETLAESFLTKFPSINPLSAHAITSSGCTLQEFLELSAEARIQVLRKYHVPDESISLFSVLCKHGELEGSKSVITESSSSVSSPPETEKLVHKINSEERKPKFLPSSCDAMYDFGCSVPPSEYLDDSFTSQGKKRPLDDPRLFKSRKNSPRTKLFDEEVFNQAGIPDTTSNQDPFKQWHRSNHAGTPKIFPRDDGFAESPLHLNDGFFDQLQFRMTAKSKPEYDGNMLQDMHEDLINEVNINGRPFMGEYFQTAEKAVMSSPYESEMGITNTPRHNRRARRLSFGGSGSSYPTFPSAEEMNMKSSLEESSQKRVDDGDDYNGVGYNWSNSAFRPQKELLEERLIEKSMQKFSMPLFKEEVSSSYRETPLSKAIKSGHLQQGSPWTIEFLNRIKEKRKLRQQNRPYSACVPSSNNSENVNRFTKRRNPSIQEFYKYQGGSTPSKGPKQKRQKQDT